MVGFMSLTRLFLEASDSTEHEYMQKMFFTHEMLPPCHRGKNPKPVRGCSQFVLKRFGEV